MAPKLLMNRFSSLLGIGVTRNPTVFRVLMTIPVGLGIAGLDETAVHPEESLGLTLRKASAALFLVLTAFQLIQTLVLIKAEHDGMYSF